MLLAETHATVQMTPLAQTRSPAIRAVRIERKGQPPLVLPLYPDVEYTFGRASQSSVVFVDDAVSRQHGRLWCDAEMRWVYRDLSSSNGSYRATRSRPDARLEVKGPTPVELQVGDELWLGTERCKLVLLDDVTNARSEQLSSVASQALERAMAIAARHSSAVVLLGPSGSGKTFTARRIHALSGRTGPIVSVNCATLPLDPQTLKSELLGHLSGAFTGATQRRIGKLYAAHEGTLFLDEVESLSPEAQGFLLDVLERTGSFAPLGASGDAQPEPPRFRLISASKTPLLQTRLRRDLVERLLGDAITMPGLADRADDIPRLVERFLAELRDRQTIDAEVTADAMERLKSRAWPGQVRELRRVIEVTAMRQAAERLARGLDTERLVIGLEALNEHLSNQAQVLGAPLSLPSSQLPALGEEPSTGLGVPPTTQERAMTEDRTRASINPRHISRAEAEAALAAHGGNKTHAAQALGVALNTFKKKLQQ